MQHIHRQIRKINSNTKLNILIKPQEETTREEGKKKKEQQKQIQIRTYISIIILNVNGLNAQPKTDWLNGYKKISYICYLQGPTSLLGTHTN